MEQKIIDYDILVADSTAQLVEQIKSKIAEGYEPYGFLKVQGEYQYTSYTQAIVKYTERYVIGEDIPNLDHVCDHDCEHKK